MAVTMNSVNVNNTSFKGSYSRTEQGNPYYKTSAGTTAGAVLAVPAFAMHAVQATGDNKWLVDIYKQANAPKKLVQDLENELARNKKFAIPTAIVAAATALGSGMIVDNIRNNKAKEVADLTKQVGVKNAMIHGEGVAISQNGRTYYDSNIGAKYGALLGAGCGVLSTVIGYMKSSGSELMKEANKLPGAKGGQVFGTIMGIGMFALGGWLMGKIADHNTNKAAARKA